MASVTTLTRRFVPSKLPRHGMRGVGKGGGVARWVLSAPLLTFLAAFVLYPLGLGIWTALTNKSLLVVDTKFIGLDNIRATLEDDRFWSSFRFTVKFTLLTTFATLTTGYWLAILVNRRFPGKRLLFTLLLMPIMVAPALMGVMFSLLLNDNIGAVPEVAFSLLGTRLSLFDPDWTVELLMVLEILQWTPFTFLIMYANLQGYSGERGRGGTNGRRIGMAVEPARDSTANGAFVLRGRILARCRCLAHVRCNQRVDGRRAGRPDDHAEYLCVQAGLRRSQFRPSCCGIAGHHVVDAATNSLDRFSTE